MRLDIRAELYQQMYPQNKTTPGCKNGANAYTLPLHLSPKAKLDRAEHRISYDPRNLMALVVQCIKLYCTNNMYRTVPIKPCAVRRLVTNPRILYELRS